MKSPTGKIATGILLIVVGLGLLVLLYQRTSRTLETKQAGAGWQAVLAEQFKTEAEGLDSWLSLTGVASGIYLASLGARAWARDREYRRLYDYPS